jgi:hypothetical protein
MLPCVVNAIIVYKKDVCSPIRLAHCFSSGDHSSTMLMLFLCFKVEIIAKVKEDKIHIVACRTSMCGGGRLRGSHCYEHGGGGRGDEHNTVKD